MNKRKKMINRCVIITLILLLFSSHAKTAEWTAQQSVTSENTPSNDPVNEPEKKPSVGKKIFDLLIVRPISVGAATVSTGVFIVTLPFTFPTGVSETSSRILVEAPWRYASGRYLGEWDHYRDEKPITVIEDVGP